MGLASIIVVALTAVVLIFSTLVGMFRGRNRSILRLVLVLLCGVGAFLLREVFVNLLLNLEIGGESLGTTITNAVSELPEEVVVLMTSLLGVVLSLVVYLVVFYLLRLITWAIIYPIFKIFIKKGEKKGKGLGALFGFVQGLLIVMLAVAPLSGVVSAGDRISKLKVGEQTLVPENVVQIFSDYGITDYGTSPVGSVYETIGGWYFELITTTTKDDGSAISLPGLMDMAEATVEVVGAFVAGAEDVDIIVSETATKEEKIAALKDFGAQIKTAGQKANELGVDEQEILNSLAELAVSVLGGDTGGESVAIAGEGANLDAAGDAIVGIANYYETETITDEKITEIVNGFASNPIMIDTLGGQVIQEVAEADKPRFEAAINATNLSQTRKDKMKAMFGIAIIVDPGV